MVRGRVVFVVLRSGDDDHDTDGLSDALPLARFLYSHRRGLTGLDDQGAVETGRRINNRFPPELFLSFCPTGHFTIKSFDLVLGLWRSNQ